MFYFFNAFFFKSVLIFLNFKLFKLYNYIYLFKSFNYIYLNNEVC